MSAAHAANVKEFTDSEQNIVPGESRVLSLAVIINMSKKSRGKWFILSN